MNEIEETIRNQMDLIWNSKRFKEWRKKYKVLANDIIIINNTFLLRKGKNSNLSKSSKYLVFKRNSSKSSREYSIFVVDREKKLIGDFKKVSENANDYPQTGELKMLENEIEIEIENTGMIVFTLIGKISQDEPCEVEISNKDIKKIVWDNSKSNIELNQKDSTLVIPDVYDKELWKKLDDKLQSNGILLSKNDLKQRIEKGIEQIKREAVSILEIPKPNESINKTFLTMFIDSIEEELQIYNKYLKEKNINELLRIAYNFVDDGLSLYHLIRSVCDLKPLILWGTIYQHYNLNEKLQDIPEIIPGKKVDLGEYENMIKDARNRRFHRLFNFKRSVEVTLPDGSIKQPKLRMFAEYGSRRSNNEFSFEDQELVELLLNFKRSKELILSDDFWKKNHLVLEACLHLFLETEGILKLILNYNK